MVYDILALLSPTILIGCFLVWRHQSRSKDAPAARAPQSRQEPPLATKPNEPRPEPVISRPTPKRDQSPAQGMKAQKDDAIASLMGSKAQTSGGADMNVDDQEPKRVKPKTQNAPEDLFPITFNQNFGRDHPPS
jgi:hypothetical protein